MKQIMKYCDICWKVLPSSSHEKLHISSEKHKSNLEFKSNLNECFNYNTYFCKTCYIQTNTELQLQNHMSSKKHSKKIADKDFILKNYINNNSEVVNINSNKIGLNMELVHTSVTSNNEKSFMNKLLTATTIILKNYKKSLSNASLASSMQSSCSSSTSSLDKREVINIQNLIVSTEKSQHEKFINLQNSEDQWCKICYVRYTSKQNKDQHLKGQTHCKRKEFSHKYKNFFLDKVNCCRICLIMVNDKSQLEKHLKSENHERAVKQYKVYFKANLENNFDNQVELPFIIDENDELIENLKYDNQNLIRFVSNCNNSLGSLKTNSIDKRNKKINIDGLYTEFYYQKRFLNSNKIDFIDIELREKWNEISLKFGDLKKILQ